jgi:hypothetical protein
MPIELEENLPAIEVYTLVEVMARVVDDHVM